MILAAKDPVACADGNGFSFCELCSSLTQLAQEPDLMPVLNYMICSIRERAKNHRSTTSDWNAKIREQRIQQIQSHSHYYDGK